ncbi:19524_t:CDS:1, partial [Dentiscutata erythropus]
DFSDANFYDEYDEIDVIDEIDVNKDYNNMDEYSDDTNDKDDDNIYDEFKSADEITSLFSTNFKRNPNVEYKSKFINTDHLAKQFNLFPQNN